MRLWRKHEAPPRPSVVLGLEDGDTLTASSATLEDGGTDPAFGDAVVSLQDPASVPAALGEKLGWRPGIPLFFAGPSPLVVGSAVALVVPRYEEGHAMVRDAREVLREARWRAADVVRERAARYFGCPLEDIETRQSSLEHWRETSDDVSVTVFQSCAPRWDRERVCVALPAIPGARVANLPLLLARRVGGGDMPEGILHTEDDCTVFSVRRRGVLAHVRCVRVGMNDLRRHLRSVLDCSEREADILLRLALSGELSAGSHRIVLRVVRQLLPLWAGVFRTVAGDIPEAERPGALLVTGRIPALVKAVFCRPQFLARCLAPPMRVTVLSGATGGDARDVFAMLHAALASLLGSATPGRSGAARARSRVAPRAITPA